MREMLRIVWGDRGWEVAVDRRRGRERSAGS
jgi:hypothetical protein